MVHHLQVQVQVKVGAAVPLFMGRGNWSLSNTTSPGAWAEAYLGTKWHLDPSSYLATTDMGRKLGDGALPLWGELGPNLTQCRLGRGLHLPTKWHIDPSRRFATTDSD